MSLVFNDTTTQSGIVQNLERALGFNPAEISGNQTRLAQFTADVNSALDDALHIIFRHSGTWQYDDTNHPDYPILTTNLISGQADYTFTADDAGNLLLDIHRVEQLKNGQYIGLSQYDRQRGGTGDYDVTANGIFLAEAPSEDITDGLRVYVNREASHFAVTDTDKRPGFAGLYHYYLVAHVAARYAAHHGLKNKDDLMLEKLRLETSMAQHYTQRAMSSSHRMVPLTSNTR